MEAVRELAPVTGVAAACRAFGLPRVAWYRSLQREQKVPAAVARPTPARALSAPERQAVLDTLHSERFVDEPPPQVYAALLDQGRYLCSVRTMYRILEAEGEVRERRNQLSHPQYEKPELLASGFSRYTVGWMVAHRESAALANRFIHETCCKQGIVEGQLTVHADRGPSMKSKCVAMLLADLGVTKTHSRPHTANDNPFSESQFKTLKYRPEFPARFGSIQDSRAFCKEFFTWYNTHHHHSGIGLLTPETVHYGRAEQQIAARQRALDRAHQLHPERFVRKRPQAPQLPEAVWINPPRLPRQTREGETQQLLPN